jgi:hypothetical protein
MTNAQKNHWLFIDIALIEKGIHEAFFSLLQVLLLLYTTTTSKSTKVCRPLLQFSVLEVGSRVIVVLRRRTKEASPFYYQLSTTTILLL